MISLDARDLAVEIGGTPLLEGLTLTVAAGEKIGVVGRNGAGKTTLLQVLAGDAPPLAGSVTRRGAVGYLRQDPRQLRGDDDRTGLAHILGGRGLDELAHRLEAARLELEEHPSARNVGRFSRLEERYRDEGGYSAEAEVKRIAAGLGLAVDRL